MANAKTICAIMACILLGTPLHSQHSSKYGSKNEFTLDDSTKDVIPSISFGNYFTNKVVFWGRDAGVKQDGLAPYVLFNTGKGLYAYALNNYWSATPAKPAETDIGVGYEIQMTKKLYASAGYERWLVHYGGYYNRYSLKNYFEAQVNYEFPWFNLQPMTYYMFGK